MDRQHLVSDSDAEIGLHILSKTTNFDYEIDQFLRELPSLFAWVRRWAWSWAYSGFGRSVLKSEHDIVLRKLCNLREYEHRVKARLEHGIWARSTEYGFVISGPVLKPDGRVRICVDLIKLNQAMHREIHPMMSVDKSLAKLGKSKIFTKLDANSSFWQLPLWLCEEFQAIDHLHLLVG